MYAAEHARRHPDQPVFVMAASGLVVTYAEFEAAANRLAHLFRDHGLRRTDHVAFLFPNDVRMLEAEGAAERTGLYYTCINSHLTAEEFAYVVDDCRARVVVTSEAMREVAASLPEQCPRVERWLMSGVPATSALPSGFERYEEAVAGYLTGPVDDEQLGAAMLYSSGTTGRPKGILRPLPEGHPADQLPIMEFANVLYRFRAGQTYLSPAPLYHSAPQACVSATVRLGGTAVIMERFDPVQFLELVERHRVTHVQMVPTMFSRLLKLPDEVRTSFDVSSLEAVSHTAAPCPVPVKEQMIEWFGPIILEVYGATEGIGYTACDSHEWLAHRGTVGKPVLGELLILDDDGNPRPVGTPGQVWFRGATNFEYFNAPEKTLDSRDGAGTTSTVGDIGFVDDDGYLHLTDRATYMIISGGVNIYPQETENLLITHPKVLDAAVFGVPNTDLGEEVKAVVQLVEGIEPSAELEAELTAFCREHLAHFKCPRTVDFVPELPRLPTGKLYKRLLRDQYWAGRSTSIV